MKSPLGNFIRLLVLAALMLSSAAAFAQDEATSDASAPPFMGIRYTGVDEGLFLTGIIPNTPAAAANLQPFDVVTAVNGNAIQVDSVRERVWIYDIGDSITLTVLRDGASLDTPLTLMARPDDVFNNPDYPMPLDLARIGLYVGECGDHLLIVDAHPESQVAYAGFHRYDEILAIDGDSVSSIAEADAAVSDLAVGEVLSFVVRRGERELVVKTLVEDMRRRNPRHRPTPRPREDIQSRYTTDALSLGYGSDFAQVLALHEAHDLYAAGLRELDVIREANGAPIAEADGFFDSPTIDLTIQRADANLQFEVPGTAAALLMFGQDAPTQQDQTQWLGLHEKQVTLGVRYLQLPPDSEHFQMTEIANGALVVEVIEGLPAEAAGIQVGDIIAAVAGEATTLEYDLRNRIYFHEPGEVVTLDILRGEQFMPIDVTLRVAK